MKSQSPGTPRRRLGAPHRMIRSPSERPAGRPEVALGLSQATTLALATPYAVVHRVRYPACTMRLLLVTPPMIQLNTPYPATAYLMGFLRLHAADLGLELTQADASLMLFLRLFSGPLVARAADVLGQRVRTAGKRGPVAWHFVSSGARFFPKGHASTI